MQSPLTRDPFPGDLDPCFLLKTPHVMPERHQFTRVDFHHFKAFERFTLNLRRFNILVGPNNTGKSTILAAFRILAAALRKATSRRAEIYADLRIGSTAIL
jgi:predicted ATPase